MDENEQDGPSQDADQSSEAGNAPTEQTPKEGASPYQPGQGGVGGGGYQPGQSEMPGAITSRPED